MKPLHWARAALPLAILLLLSGCDTPTVPSATPDAGAYHGGRVYRGGLSETDKYTQADYDLALSFRTDGYEALSVAQFNQGVMDWSDEEAFHKSEDAIRRLYRTLPEDDPNAAFIHTVLSHTWDECSVKHYNACARSQAPSHSGAAAYERFGDIFGDRVLLAGGYAEYWFDYTLVDASALTVGEREAIFAQIDQDMTAFLAGRTEAARSDEEAMEKALLAQLNKILAGLDGKQITTAESGLSYWWDEPYGGYYDDGDPLGNNTITSENAYGGAQRAKYTKQQYDALLAALQPQGWADMSIAEFNRRLNAAFQDGDTADWTDSVSYLYELVISTLPEDDPNAPFLLGTVPASMEEYRAMSAQVYSGKTRDPLYRDWVNGSREEDVYGDRVPVAFVEAGYRFTYRLLEPDKLTVAERDAFLNRINQAVQDSLKEPSLTQQGFQSALERAGAAAKAPGIQFTGCKVDSFQAWSDY